MNTPLPAATPQNLQGLYHKYNVTRTDERDLPGQKHHGCDYFVLDLSHDRHAIPALAAYADSCAAEYPALATDLRARISSIVTSANEFITVPETTLPNGQVVPAFRVGRYFTSRGPAGIPIITADGTPWTRINYHEARSACAQASYGLLKETQALALAWDISQQAANWSSGVAGEGFLHQGLHLGSVNQAQAGSQQPNDPKEQRWFVLSNGERICDAAGNIYTWIFDDLQGDDNGLTAIIKADSPSLQAPYPPMTNGMGWRPDGERDWTGRALLRGGCWHSESNAGVFYLSDVWSDSRGGIVGFRCTLPGL